MIVGLIQSELIGFCGDNVKRDAEQFRITRNVTYINAININ